MAHVRQQLREQVADAVTSLTTTGSRVFQTRLYPLSTSDLPCLIVTTESDTVEYLTIGQAEIERDILVHIKGYARENSDLDDKLDDIGADVEAAIYAADLIAKDVRLIGTDLDESAVGEKPVGVITLIYSMKVYTRDGSPETAL